MQLHHTQFPWIPIPIAEFLPLLLTCTLLQKLLGLLTNYIWNEFCTLFMGIISAFQKKSLLLPMILLYQYLGESVFDYFCKDSVGRQFQKSMSVSKQNIETTSCFQPLDTAGLDSSFCVGAQCTKMCN